jgi:N-acetylmuramoyl-L-alanine amidase
MADQSSRPGINSLPIIRHALATVALALATALIGCQSNTSVTGQPLPAPNFAGPVVAPRSPAIAYLPPAPPLILAPVRPAPHSTVGVPRDWIPVVAARPWRWIVIHHSATPNGNAAVFDRDHREKGWDELGYHFVIGNGTDSGDGQVEVGPRWPIQKHGAHAKTPSEEFNNFGIGICLVGNFDEERPTPAQMRSCAKLVAFLMKNYNIHPDHVLGHNNTKPTDCPGRFMSVATVRRMAVQMLNDGAFADGTAAAPMRTVDISDPAGK